MFILQDIRCSDRRSLKSTGSSSRCRSHSPLKVECISSTSLNSTGDSGHGSSPGSSGGSLPTRSRTVIEHAHKTTIAHDLSHKSTIVASFAQYPHSQNELELKLESSNSLSPANIPMLVVESYFPPKEWTSRDEVPVTRGMVVNAMFKSCEWICVRTPLERTGFIPFCCVQAKGIKKNTKDFSQQFPETQATKAIHRKIPFKKSNSLNRTYHHYNVDKGTQSDSEMLTVKRAVREAAKTAVRGYHKKTVQSDLNNNKRPVLVKDQRAFTQPLPCKAMKPVVAPQQSTVPHKNTTVPSQTEIKPELPQKKVTKQERVPQCPSSVERRRQKAKEIYFAHDMSSIGFMLPHVKSPVKSPVLTSSTGAFALPSIGYRFSLKITGNILSLDYQSKCTPGQKTLHRTKEGMGFFQCQKWLRTLPFLACCKIHNTVKFPLLVEVVPNCILFVQKVFLRSLNDESNWYDRFSFHLSLQIWLNELTSISKCI